MKLSKPMLLVAGAMLSGFVSFAPIQAKAASIAPAAATAPNPLMPTDVNAKIEVADGAAAVRLNWKAAPKAAYYRIQRINTGITTLPGTTYLDAGVNEGRNYTYWVIGYDSTGQGAYSAAVKISVPKSAPASGNPPPNNPPPKTPPAGLPPSPAGLTAAPQWENSCPVCKVAMAHIVLYWDSVGSAKSYRLYRDGVLIQSGVKGTAYQDMAITSGEAYTYTVSSVSAVGEGPQSAPVKVTAPSPPKGGVAGSDGAGASPVPTNLRVQGLWQGGQTDVLTWNPAPNAGSYNVYQYDMLLAAGVTATSYSIPASAWRGFMNYTVTSVDANGIESHPSNPATTQGASNPAIQPKWLAGPPHPVTEVVATPEWNAGAPRVLVTWHGSGFDFTYNVYRDGKLAAAGLWALTYLDNDVAPGATHSYTVTGCNVRWTTAQESAPSASVTATALSAAPARLAQKVQITGVVPNDDSAVVSFDAVPGAADYRIYSTASPSVVKYSGGSLSIEMNGLDPSNVNTLVVEAVDKLGPFQKMDAVVGPGVMQMDGALDEAINGQGDPSNIPNVLATSDPISVTCQPTTLAGDQVFFDNFRDDQPFVPVPNPAGSHPVTDDTYDEKTFQNNNWQAQLFGADMAMSQLFFMNNHFMDTLYDGPTAATHSFSHNNNATMVMTPRQSFDFSGGRVLHVTMEVDATTNGRRWLGIYLTPAGDVFYNPGKFLEGNTVPTRSGKIFRWKINDMDNCDFFDGSSTTLANEQTIVVDGMNNTLTVGAKILHTTQRSNDHSNGAVPYNFFNDQQDDLDHRHKFDLYLSATHIQMYEQGVLVADRDLPKPLPFTDADVHFIHQVYHTGNDRPGNVEIGPDKEYYYNYRPWADERHWDACGASVLGAFPGM